MRRNLAGPGSPMVRGVCLSLLALVVALVVSTPARGQDDGPPVLPDSATAVRIESRPDTEGYVAAKRPLLAASEVVTVNALVWSYDRYIRENGTNPGFRIGFNSFEENIKNGFEFDDNDFPTNMYAHPYHGDLYFNAARSNGMSFWGSVPYTWGGSFMWEFFGEVHHPAINDWILTSMGGMALGEVFFRFSQMVTDNTATGSRRTWGELGGTLINPVRGFTRLVTGEWSQVQPNPPDRFPHSSHVSYRVGIRTSGHGHLWEADTSRVFMEIAANIGDPFLGDHKKPFDTFDFGFQLNFNDKQTIGRMQTIGLLAAAPAMETDHSKHMIGFTQHFDYFNNSDFELGGQSLATSVYSQFRAGENFAVRTQLHLNAIVMAGTKNDYPSFTGRSYDFGPGLGFKFGGTFYYHHHPFLILSHSRFWIHSINGSIADHLISATRARLDVPLTQGVSVGADYWLYTADRLYRDYPDVYERVPELRTGVSFNL
jgi:hypothetical protein